MNGGMGRSVAMFYLFYVQAWLSLAAFARIFGLPLRTATFEDGASAEDMAILERALHSMGSEAVALLKKGMTFKIERANASGNAGSDQFFASYIKLIEESVQMAVLGQTMTSQNGGGSLAKAEVGERSKDMQVRALAFQLSATIRASIVRPMVDLNLGPDRPAPDVWLDVEDGDDIKLLADGLVKLIDRGLPVRAVEVLDRCGLQRPEGMPEDLVLVPLGSWATGNKAANDTEDDASSMARALANVVEQLNGGRDLRVVCDALAPVLGPLGYKVERKRNRAKGDATEETQGAA
jgi:phage gp29-like protein